MQSRQIVSKKSLKSRHPNWNKFILIVVGILALVDLYILFNTVIGDLSDMGKSPGCMRSGDAVYYQNPTNYFQDAILILLAAGVILLVLGMFKYKSVKFKFVAITCLVLIGGGVILHSVGQGIGQGIGCIPF